MMLEPPGLYTQVSKQAMDTVRFITVHHPLPKTPNEEVPDMPSSATMSGLMGYSQNRQFLSLLHAQDALSSKELIHLVDEEGH